MKKENKKNIVIAVLTTIVVAFVALLIVGLSLPEEPVVTSQSTDEMVYEGFMEGCTEDSLLSNSICSCMYYVLEGEHGTDGIMKAGVELASNREIKENFYDNAIDQCL